MNNGRPIIAVLGASGLVGEAVAANLGRAGLPVVAIARRFTEAQKAKFGAGAVESDIVASDAGTLGALLAEYGVDIVVNCIGLLQDRPGERADEVHCRFVLRLLTALEAQRKPALLIQISIPGKDADDKTQFSRTKRAAERLIAEGPVPFVILRPGFVIAPSAYGGGALFRSLAALPLGLPDAVAVRPFAVTGIADISRTIEIVSREWGEGKRQWAAVWDVMEHQPGSVGDVLAAFRKYFGGPRAIVRSPAWLVDVAAKAGDIAAYLGWVPPVRSTALGEMRRGVAGDPATWMSSTGIEPLSLDDALRSLPVNVQESWFSRLYLAKPLIVGSLVVFWVLSGMIALTIAFDAATGILLAHGVPVWLAGTVTVVSSLADILVGVAIAFRKTCRIGLMTGIAVSLFYMIGAAAITPELYVEPLGALVKTFPAIVLMLVGLAILPDRGR